MTGPLQSGRERWLRTATEALAEQERLRSLVDTSDPGPGVVRNAAGLDVAYTPDSNLAVGAAVVLSLDGLQVLEAATATVEVDFPYIPGLLAFREVPALLAALDRLTTMPDVLVCDGHGLAHPRRFGLACHVGVLTGRSTFGVAKTPYWGTHEEPASDRGAWSSLMDGGEIIGRVLRTRTGAKPVYVSVGHRVALDTACRTALRLAAHHRLPETTRLADQLSRRTLADRLHQAAR